MWVEAEISLPAKKFVKKTGNVNILVITGEVEEVADGYITLTTGEVIVHPNSCVKIRILENVSSFSSK